ncbi:hypothetical protein SedNR2807_27780 [Citrobacter sedlakii]
MVRMSVSKRNNKTVALSKMKICKTDAWQSGRRVHDNNVRFLYARNRYISVDSDIFI